MATTPIRKLGATLLPGALAILGVAALALAQTPETIIIDSGLDRAVIEIKPGTKVIWRNDDSQRHRMRSREGPVEFDSGNLRSGETFSFTFEIEGSYPYLDHRDDQDPAYYGTVIVGGPGVLTGPLPDSGEVSIINRSFRPGSITAASGATITWTNDDGEAHTVTSTESAFDSGIVGGGVAFSQTFDEPGTYPYFCAIHPEMRGTITISEPATGVAAELPAESAAGPNAADEVAPAQDLPTTEATTTTASIVDFSFQPGALEVSAGTSITWSNDDGVGHTVTAVDGAFDSGVLTVADTFSQTFDQEGTFEYFCAIHPQMRGTVTVAAADSG